MLFTQSGNKALPFLHLELWLTVKGSYCLLPSAQASQAGVVEGLGFKLLTVLGVFVVCLFYCCYICCKDLTWKSSKSFSLHCENTDVHERRAGEGPAGWIPLVLLLPCSVPQGGHPTARRRQVWQELCLLCHAVSKQPGQSPSRPCSPHRVWAVPCPCSLDNPVPLEPGQSLGSAMPLHPLQPGQYPTPAAWAVLLWLQLLCAARGLQVTQSSTCAGWPLAMCTCCLGNPASSAAGGCSTPPTTAASATLMQDSVCKATCMEPR